MAGIDKTYTNNYQEYKAFKEWASTQYVTFFDGLKKCIGDWVWDRDEDEFRDGREISIMNTPTWLDIYLIQKCKFEFVLDRMKYVYGEESFEEFKTIDLSAKPSSEYQQNRKIKFKLHKYSKFPIHNKPYPIYKNNTRFKRNTLWALDCDETGYWYNRDTKRWVNYEQYYPTDTNIAHVPSLKAIVRHLRKQYLPKGLTFTIHGIYVGETYTVVVS